MNEQFYKILCKTKLNNLIYNYSRIKLVNNTYDPNMKAKDISMLREDCKSSCIVRRQEEWLSYEYDLDIIIPVYNTGILLEKCILSAINQNTNYSYRIIIVDDGSTDSETLDILKKYDSDEKVNIIHNENGGVSKARNYALNISRGRFISFLDADDYLYEDSIEKLLQLAISENADIVEGGYNNVSMNDDIINSISHEQGIIEDISGYAWGKVFARKLFYQIQYPTYTFEDSIIKTIINSLAEKKIGISNPVYAYRRNRRSISYTLQGNSKSIDSYWITRQINNDRAELGLDKNQNYYEYLLNVIKLTFRRNIHLDDDYQLDIFLRFCSDMEEYIEFNTNKVDMKDLELSIRTGNYKLYSLWNKMHMF